MLCCVAGNNDFALTTTHSPEFPWGIAFEYGERAPCVIKDMAPVVTWFRGSVRKKTGRYERSQCLTTCFSRKQDGQASSFTTCLVDPHHCICMPILAPWAQAFRAQHPLIAGMIVSQGPMTDLTHAAVCSPFVTHSSLDEPRKTTTLTMIALLDHLRPVKSASEIR